MANTQAVEWDMYEMEYKGVMPKFVLSLVPFEEKYYKQYTNLVDDCFYEMRKALNIRPYGKHSYSLGEPIELKENTFLLLDDGEIVGAVTCSGTDIRTVAVNPNHQRKGHGRKLTEFAINYMQNRGDTTIKLTVTKWNKNAIALYKSLGFVITKELSVRGVNTKDIDGHGKRMKQKNGKMPQRGQEANENTF